MQDGAHLSLNPRRQPDSADLDDGAGADDEFVQLVRRQLELIGEDPDRQGLKRTPERVANALAWLTRGYEMDVQQVVNGALFDAEGGCNMIMVRDIELYSLCEHHMLPFYGRAHIAYIPNGKIVGLSKVARLVEVFARRLQVQERLTEQIAGSASPRKPKLATPTRSAAFRILDVAWRSRASSASSRSIPEPSSLTRMS